MVAETPGKRASAPMPEGGMGGMDF
jgi:hypothetical protein